MRIFSIIFLSLLGVIVVGLTLYLLIMRVCFHVAIGRKNTIRRVNKNVKIINKYKVDLCWWQKYHFEDFNIVSEDGLKLKGHYLDRNKDKTVILVHGYGSDYREMSNYANMFYNFGYNILSIENRGHGKSEGRYIGMGWLDRLDLLSWINFLVDKKPEQKIVLFGLSMGASTVCMALGEKLPNNVICAIEDCGYDNIYTQFEYVYHSRTKFPTKAMVKMFNRYMIRNYNFNLKEGDALSALKKCKIPVMFIHGSMDKFVPTEMVYRLADCIPHERREVMIVEGAEHAMSYPTDPNQYEHRVRKFLNKYVK